MGLFGSLSRWREGGRRLLLLLVALLGLCAPAQAQQSVGTGRNTITIGVGEGRLVRLDRDATNVFVANSQIADVQVASGRLIYIYGRRLGLTTLTAVGAQDSIAGALQIRVERNPDAAQGAVAARAPAVQLSFAGDRLVVRGPVSDVGQAMEVESTVQAYSPNNLPPLDRTRLAGAQQVTLRVRIAEVSRNDLNRLGVNLAVLAQPGSFTVGFLTNSVVSGLAGDGSLLASLGLQTNRVQANALIDALQREGVLTLLAEPNLTTLSGETASFLAGGEVPIPVPQAFGVTTVQYKPFGVALAFTPTILPGNRIAMRVRPEVSEISNQSALTSTNGQIFPAFTTRRVETNVEMASGQTIAIAGLFQRRLQDDLDRVPLLGDIPILGALFRSQRFQRQETELMVLITPFLSGAVIGSGTIPVPTDPLDSRPRPAARAGFVVN